MNELLIQTRDALLEAGVSPKKALSQNFLINENVLNRQIDYALLTKNDIVLEIGGGTGTLTEKLNKKVKKVISIEYDKNLSNYLIRKFQKNNNVTIINSDVLKIDLPIADKVVANLPYHLSSPITFKLLNYKFSIAILMYQYEFAQRMIALPGSKDYSRLTANLQLLADVIILERVPRSYFYPMPKVDSAIVKIIPKKKIPPVNIESYQIITRILFNNKNKLVSAVLYEYFRKIIPKDERINFKNALYNEISCIKKRVRNLTVEELIDITKDLTNFLERSMKIELLK